MTKAGLPLTDWLRRLETLSPREIELGLDRVLEVSGRMGLDRPSRVIHVAGTNGKGSSVAMLRSLLSAPDAIVGTYTSPHVIHYNERICIDGEPAGDTQIVAAFERVEAARKDVALTYFEYGTLAAMAVFDVMNVDTAILEVGMGGRLDAVNAIEPDAGLITNVSLDHCEWLGNDIETIGFEKAGIMRGGEPVVFADPSVPASVQQQADRIGARLILAGRDYTWTAVDDGSWSWQGQGHELPSLARPSLAGDMQVQNAAGVLALIEALGLDGLLAPATVDAAFGRLSLPGRMQLLRREHDWLFDVAHNSAAATALAATMQRSGTTPSVAIIGMLDDKDVEGIVVALAGIVDHWIAVTAASPRAIGAAELGRRIANATNGPCVVADTQDAAIDDAREFAGSEGRILVTGSFYVVGPLLERFSKRD